jgi:hypothetical protein
MRPPLRSIRHTKTPRADHNTTCLTSVAPAGSIADRRSPNRDAGVNSTTTDALHVLRHVARERNKESARHLSWRTAILSPSPRAWPFNVGRSRYADRLRPNLLLKLSNSATQTRFPISPAHPTDIARVYAARVYAARIYALRAGATAGP